jgi:medium-chain acyl-[acyl-carrier-protein] hydrolase
VVNETKPASQPAKGRWLAHHAANSSARLRLFCFPYAGGSAVVFRNWQQSLPAAIEVCPVQLPGRGGRTMEPSITSLKEMVPAVAEGIRPFLDKPFAFFGHSMGSILSFELARYLRQHNSIQPRQLFVSGRRAPQIPDPDPPTHNLPDAEFLEELRRLNGTPQEVLDHPELMALMMPLLRSDFAVCQTYQHVPGAPLDCRITVFGGLEDKVQRADLESWREHTTSSFSTLMFPGDHFFLHSAEPRLLEAMTLQLQKLIQEI